MNDDRFDDLLKDAARDYNAPPETPRELMWARIETIRRERSRRRQQLRIVYSPWTRWGLGLAAALAIGIGIGRLTLDTGPEPQPLATTSQPDLRAGPPPPNRLAYRLATTEHLSRAEAFLVSLRAAPRAEDTAAFWSGALDLLSSTRLLLDSPAADDPVFRELLNELELVLVQIAQLSYQRGAGDLELVTEGFENRGLLTKLRAAIPAGPAVGAVAIKGAS